MPFKPLIKKRVKQKSRPRIGILFTLTTNNHKTKISEDKAGIELKRLGSRYGNRTRVLSVKGIRPNP